MHCSFSISTIIRLLLLNASLKFPDERHNWGRVVSIHMVGYSGRRGTRRSLRCGTMNSATRRTCVNRKYEARDYLINSIYTLVIYLS